MTRRAGAAWIAAVVLGGCQGAAEEASTPAPPQAAERSVEASPFALEEPAAEAIFAWLEDERHRETWDLVPGTAPLHPGADPHGTLLTTYANPVAMEALERGAPSMPPGAAFAVEDYLADTTLSAISVMLRVDDPAPDRVEWRFARYAPTGEIEAGSMDTCRSCHVLEPDLVFGWEIGTPIPVDSTGATASTTGSGSGQ